MRGNWDGSRLEQVITNLMSNALRYGGGQPICVVVVEVRPGWATVMVRDQGLGIAPEHQPLVFQRFERLIQGRHRGGFGLGLWIVRQIVDAHTGTIKLFSRPGVGSTFAVDLPTGVLPPPPLADDVVLLIDRRPEGREAFRQAAQSIGCRGLTASRVADVTALTHFGVKPRLVLFDLECTRSDDGGRQHETGEPSEMKRLPVLENVPLVAIPADSPPLNAHDLEKLVSRHFPDLAEELKQKREQQPNIS